MIETTRDKLHEEIWAEPMTKIAERYGISDVALKKICNKHRIPTPPRGYWAKHKAGQKSRRGIYHQVSDPALNRIAIQGRRSGLSPQEHNERKARARNKKREIKQAVRAVLPENSNGRHPAAERFFTRMVKKTPDHRGFVTNRIKSCFRADITPSGIERMANFLSTFAQTIDAAGHSLESADDGLLLRCDGEDISFELFEKTDRRPHVLTPREEAKLEKHEQYLEKTRNRRAYDRWGYG